MTDRKLKRLLAEKPFLIDDNFSMTGGEAELMLMENGPLSIEDMLVKARQKDGWKPEFEQMINRILANTPLARWNRLRVNLQTGLQHTWAFHAKAVVTWVIILLLTVVMVFTPVGKAVADTIKSYVVKVFDNYFIVQNEDDNGKIMVETNDSMLSDTTRDIIEKAENGDELTQQYKLSCQEFIAETGITPVILDDESYLLSDLTVFSIPGAFYELHLTYSSNSGSRIRLIHRWDTEGALVVAQDDGDTIVRESVFDGKELIGYYNEKTFDFYGTITLNNMCVVEIIIQTEIEGDYKNIIDNLKYCK